MNLDSSSTLCIQLYLRTLHNQFNGMDCQYFIGILWIYISSTVAMSVNQTGYEVKYQYEFSTIDYIKEALNSTMMKEPVDYLCRLPDPERMRVCQEASQQTFAIENGIKYVDDGPLGEEKMYELKINSGIFIVDCPLIVSACSCPTIPPMYLRNKHYGGDVRAYVEMPPVEGDKIQFGSQSSMAPAADKEHQGTFDSPFGYEDPEPLKNEDQGSLEDVEPSK